MIEKCYCPSISEFYRYLKIWYKAYIYKLIYVTIVPTQKYNNNSYNQLIIIV